MAHIVWLRQKQQREKKNNYWLFDGVNAQWFECLTGPMRTKDAIDFDQVKSINHQIDLTTN